MRAKSPFIHISLLAILLAFGAPNASASGLLKAVITIKHLPTHHQQSAHAIRILVEDELSRRGLQIVSASKHPQLNYEVNIHSLAGQWVFSITEYNASPRRRHSSAKSVIEDLRELHTRLPALCDRLLKLAQKGRTKHSTFRWGIGLTSALAIGFDSRPDQYVKFPGPMWGALLRFSFEISNFRIDIESSALTGWENHHVEIVALRAVYHPFLANISPYFGIGTSFIAQPSMVNGTHPPMFGVGMSLNAGYEFFRFGGLHILTELQINFPFLSQCAVEDPVDAHSHTPEEFQVWVPSIAFKLILMW